MMDAFLKRPGAWLALGQDTSIVISSRVRLARNLKDRPFPQWANDAVREEVWQQLLTDLPKTEALKDGLSLRMTDLPPLDRQFLLERHLISREQMDEKVGSGLVVRYDETISAMVNEEDHLRLQALRAGLDLEGTLECVSSLDDQIEAQTAYAFSAQYGYLTACPTNVGTGMRASVMLHLPGLVLMNEMGPIIRGMSKIGLAVRGLWGEGTEAVGNMFQVSNQVTLGEGEEEIVRNLQQIVVEIVQHEKNARQRLMEKKKVIVQDHVGRARGILSGAHLLSSKETLGLLSGLRLGIELGILEDVERNAVDELMISTQPAHLQKLGHKDLTVEERDRARAELVRNRLGAQQ
jgi:protein arginine kinase